MNRFFQSIRNTRLLPITDRFLVRSDFPAQITDQEVKNLKDTGITTVVDLREKKEYDVHPCRLESEPGFTYHHMPVSGGGSTPVSIEDLISRCLSMIDDQMDRIIETIEHAQSGVLYFCSAGKDRTGVVSAVLLHRMGCDDQIIIDDYMKSKDNLYAFLCEYAGAHPDVDLNLIVPHEFTIRHVPEKLKKKTV
ncbi:MAG: tyrosine-protein phosphatase [Bulleidia sp.]